MLKDVPFHIIYSSGEQEPAEFFLDALMESVRLDLGLGFFSSSGFRALSLGFAYFINRGGVMRIIINDILSPEDKQAILEGRSHSPEELIESKLVGDLESLYTVLSSRERHFFKCLSWMIATGKVEFRAIVPTGAKRGTAHQKFGVFYDERHQSVAFSGSANFSSTALFENIETVSCHQSWTGERTESERVQYFKDLFDKLWNGKLPHIGFIEIERIKTVIRDKFPVDDLETLLEDELDLANNFKEIFQENPDLEKKIRELRMKLDRLNNKPKFPAKFAPKDYQLKALENWIASNYQGFFEMATGTGKTITALNCALHLYQKEGRVRCLVLVPTLSLADQWADEVASFGFKKIIIANSKNSRWAEELIQEINKSFALNNSYFIISTYDSFAIDRFSSVVDKLGADLLFIADEAHNFGTSRLIHLHPHKFKRRIGLSATPQRYFDDAGTVEIDRFFNAVEGPTFKLDMEEAIERGYLCEYIYHPKIVYLVEDELEEYKAISMELLRYFDAATNTYQDNPKVTKLMLKRKRIIHKAKNKAECLRTCLKAIIAEKNKVEYTLVYVPEGKDPVDDSNMINDYASIITNEFGLVQHQFIGGTKDRKEVLDDFAAGRFQVLTAMKCLDEGVDVARTETAIFCSSTGNPRQFIQRRGRILRKHKAKKLATIYDMIVVPNISALGDDACVSFEKGILKSELRRVYEFAKLSKYKYTALKVLENVAEEFGLDIFSTEIS